MTSLNFSSRGLPSSQFLDFQFFFHVKVQPRIFNNIEGFFGAMSFATENDVIKNCLISKEFDERVSLEDPSN